MYVVWYHHNKVLTGTLLTQGSKQQSCDPVISQLQADIQGIFDVIYTLKNLKINFLFVWEFFLFQRKLLYLKFSTCMYIVYSTVEAILKSSNMINNYIQ